MKEQAREARSLGWVAPGIAADYCFAQPDVAELTIELATKEASGEIDAKWRDADDRSVAI